MSRYPNRTVVLLRTMPLFAECTHQQLELLGKVADEVQLPAGCVLTQQGERITRDCFVIVTGLVEVTRDGQRTGVAGPGELVGEMSLLDGRPRRAGLRTITPTRLLSFDYRGFAQLRSCPSVARKMNELYLIRSGQHNVDELGCADDDGPQLPSRQGLLHLRRRQGQLA